MDRVLDGCAGKEILSRVCCGVVRTLDVTETVDWCIGPDLYVVCAIGSALPHGTQSPGALETPAVSCLDPP